MLGKKYIVFISIIMTSIIVLVIWFSYFTENRVHDGAKKEFLNLMTEVSKTPVIAVKNDINSIRLLLSFVAEEIITHGYYSGEKNLAKEFANIYRNAERLNANDLGFLDGDGILKYTMSAPQLINENFSSRKYFIKIKEKQDPDYMNIQLIQFKGVDKGDTGLLFSMGVFKKAGRI